MSKDFVDCWILYRVRHRRPLPFFPSFQIFLGSWVFVYSCIYVQQAMDNRQPSVCTVENVRMFK